MKEFKNNSSQKIFDFIYQKAKDGISDKMFPVDKIANNYLDKNNGDIEKASKSLIKYSLVQCGTSGFFTNLGGVLSMVFTIPANISSVLFFQIRTILTLAHIGGYDIDSEQVKTLVLVCIAGTSVSDAFKQAGIKIGEKITYNTINKIPGRVLINVNKKVGFRLITKFGQKSVITVGKLIPIAGGILGAGVDVCSTKLVTKRAYDLFIKNKNVSSDDKDAIDADFVEVKAETDDLDNL